MASINNGQSQATFSNLGGEHWDGDTKCDCRKMAFFTNMYAKSIMPVNNSYITKNIEHVTFYDAADPDDFAKNETPAYKKKFKTLHNGKKFYNWAGPSLLIDEVYDTFSGYSTNDAAQE